MMASAWEKEIVSSPFFMLLCAICGVDIVESLQCNNLVFFITIGEISLEKKTGRVKTDNSKLKQEKKTMPVYVKFGIAALVVLAAIVGGLLIWLNAASGYVATIGTEKIGVKEYNFYLAMQKSNMYYQAYSLDPSLTEETFWYTQIEGTTAIEYAKKSTLEGIRDIKMQAAEAKASGIKLDAAEIKNIDDYIQKSIIDSEQIGSGNRIRANKYFEENFGTSLDIFRETQLESALAQKYQSEEAKKLDLKDTDIKEYYDKHPDWYKETTEMRTDAGEAVWARHILIKAAKDAAQDVKDAAKKKAQDLLDQLKGGADFATLAKENSEDTNAQYGGDYLFAKGVMLPEFENAAFSLNNGQLYDTLVETEFGFHIIKLEEKYAKDQPVSLRCATEYRDYGTNFIFSKLFQDKLSELRKKTEYTIDTNDEVYNSIKA